MKAQTWKIGWRRALVATILSLALGAGTAVADETGEDLCPQEVPQCPQDPEDDPQSDAIGAQGGSGGGQIAWIVGLLRVLTVP